MMVPMSSVKRTSKVSIAKKGKQNTSAANAVWASAAKKRGSEAYLHAEIQTIISNDTLRQSKHDERWKQPAGCDCRKQIKNLSWHGRQEHIIALRTDVYRLSPGLSAAYLHPEIQNSISSERPHDDGPDEQCQAQVKGQCRGKRRKNSSGSISTQ